MSAEKLKNSIDESYDSPPLWYDIRGLFILWLTYKSSLNRQIRFFSEMKSGGQHLEVAIGSGSLFQLILLGSKLRRRVPKKIFGFDYAPSMLAGALKRFRNDTSIEIFLGDATKLSLEGQQFDSIHCANAIHSIPNYPEALRETARLLKPGGQYRVNVLQPPKGFLKAVSERINEWGARKGILQRPIPREEFMAELHKAGLAIEQEFIQGNCLFVVARKPSMSPASKESGDQ